MKRPQAALLFAAIALASCSQAGHDQTAEQQVVLGPVDGRDLPASDLERVGVGDPAPDFTLEALGRAPVTLSDFRGARNVVLVFYRGHW